jgi:hypothetical protein
MFLLQKIPPFYIRNDSDNAPTTTAMLQIPVPKHSIETINSVLEFQDDLAPTNISNVSAIDIGVAII